MNQKAGQENIYQAVKDWHRINHEAPFITECREQLCADINFDGAQELGFP